MQKKTFLLGGQYNPCSLFSAARVSPNTEEKVAELGWKTLFHAVIWKWLKAKYIKMRRG